MVGHAVSKITSLYEEHRLLCDTLPAAVGHVIRNLNEEGIWPLQRDLVFDLDAILTRLEDLDWKTIRYTLYACERSYTNCRCQSAPTPGDVSKEIRDGARRLMKAIGKFQVEF